MALRLFGVALGLGRAERSFLLIDEADAIQKAHSSTPEKNDVQVIATTQGCRGFARRTQKASGATLPSSDNVFRKKPPALNIEVR